MHYVLDPLQPGRFGPETSGPVATTWVAIGPIGIFQYGTPC